MDSGHRVRVLDDGSRGHPRRLADIASRVELVVGDVRDAAAVLRACDGADVVFHLAAVNGTEFFYSKPEVVLDVGIRGILNVIEGARVENAELFVASSSEVYHSPPRVPTDERVPLVIPDPLNPRFSYAGSKIASELLAINFGRGHARRVVIFRPHNVYGPDMGWEHVVPQLALKVRERLSTPGTVELPIQGSGSETRAFVHIDDAIDGLMILFERAEHLGIYNIGVDEEVEIAQLAREIGQCYGRTVRVLPGAAPDGATSRRCPDITRLRSLGFAPRVSRADGLARTVSWYDEHAEERP